MRGFLLASDDLANVNANAIANIAEVDARAGAMAGTSYQRTCVLRIGTVEASFISEGTENLADWRESKWEISLSLK